MADWKLVIATPSIGTAISGELQVCQPGLGAREGFGADHLEHNPAAHPGYQGHQAQSGWAFERQVLVDQPGLLL